MTESKLIMGVPGLWKNRTELIQEVATKSGGYILAGNIIHNAKKNVGFEIDVYEHEPTLSQAFLYAGEERFSQEDLDEIDKHTHTVYIIVEPKDFRTVKETMNAVTGLLKAGGIAVKNETAGLAFLKNEWLDIANEQDYFPVYSNFVRLIGDEQNYYSCGMQAFGMPDVMVSTHFTPEEAAEILNHFNLYNLTEQPTFNNGETLSFGDNSPMYKLTKWEDSRYDSADDVLYNPSGIWELSSL